MIFNNEFVSGGLVLVVAGGLLAYFRKLPEQIWRLVERFFIIRLDIYDSDESFHWVNLWLGNKLDSSLSMSVLTRRIKKDRDIDDENDLYRYQDGDDTDKRPQITFIPSPGTYFSWYKGCFCVIYKNRVDPSASGESGAAAGRVRESISIHIFSRNRDIAKKLVEETRDAALPLDGKIEVRNARYSSWSLTARIRPRSLDSVVLDGDKANFILGDVKKFLKNADWYSRLGIPYRRGYLLYGAPGNGKSSCVMAIASALQMDINVLNLTGAGINDSSIYDLLSAVGTNNIVLIEDIDCAYVQRKAVGRRQEEGLTFSGLLNALDGIAAQEGRIIFMTTNHHEKLDPALIRPGRVDVQIHLDNASRSQAFRLFNRFFPEQEEYAKSFAERMQESNVSMAALQGHMEIYQNDPRAACEHVIKLGE